MGFLVSELQERKMQPGNGHVIPDSACSGLQPWEICLLGLVGRFARLGWVVTVARSPQLSRAEKSEIRRTEYVALLSLNVT